MFPCRVGRDDGFAAAFSKPVAELTGVIGTICEQALWGRDAQQQQRSDANQVVGLTGRQGKRDGPSDVIGYGVNFGCPSAARAADGLLVVPPFAPAAERCAFTWGESTDVVCITPLEPLRA